MLLGFGVSMTQRTGPPVATKVDIISGFLGAGKTTLINKLLVEIGERERVAVVENEVGEIGIDGQVLASSGIEVREITKGCICCTLFGDFVSSLRELLDTYELDRIIVEPTGIGRLSDVIKACQAVRSHHALQFNIIATVVDCSKWEAFSTTFGDFFRDQVRGAGVVFLSRVANAESALVDRVSREVASMNPVAEIVATCWEAASGGLVELAERGSVDPASWAALTETVNVDVETWCAETNTAFGLADLRERLKALDDRESCGDVIRGKGIVKTTDDKWVLFDYLPGEINLREVEHQGDGKIVIIGPSIKPAGLHELFIEGRVQCRRRDSVTS